LTGEAVPAHFREHGLTVGSYLRAAVLQPSLFYRSPATVIGHVNLLIDLYRQELLSVPGQGNTPSDQPLRPLLAFLVRNPQFFAFADDNYALREIYARTMPEPPQGAALLTRPRHRVERELADALGHDYLDTPVAKAPAPSAGGEPGAHARNLLLRALIQEGLVKGTLR
jgi:hypothetical protein